jgi:hypothetical protein
MKCQGCALSAEGAVWARDMSFSIILLSRFILLFAQKISNKGSISSNVGSVEVYSDCRDPVNFMCCLG